MTVTTVPVGDFDRVVLAELDAHSVELVALAVGQSVGMEYYEDTVDGLVAQLEGASKHLADTGRLNDKNRELLRFIGRGMSTRTQVVHTLALLDAPALAWDNEPLDKLYRDLRASFAIEDRYRALDQKRRRGSMALQKSRPSGGALRASRSTRGGDDQPGLGRTLVGVGEPAPISCDGA